MGAKLKMSVQGPLPYIWNPLYNKNCIGMHTVLVFNFTIQLRALEEVGKQLG